MKQPKRKYLSYAKWGYIFIIPFFLSFFHLFPDPAGGYHPLQLL